MLAFSPIVFGGRTLSAAGKGIPGVTGTTPFPSQPPADFEPDFRPDQGASTWAFEPWSKANDRAYANGEIPFWNPDIGLGAPQAANMQSAPFDPLLVAVNLHPTQGTWDFALVGAFVLGAAAMYCFARILGLDVVPSVVASATFSMSGFYFLYSNDQFSRSYIYLPVLFALVELVLRSKRLLPVFGLALAVAGNVLLGMPEATLFVVGTSFVYALARIVQQRRAIAAKDAILRVGGGFFLGALLASPVLLLFQQYEGLSFNVHQSDSGQGVLTEPMWGLLNWIVPFFHGVKGQFNAPGLRNWVGVAAVVVAIVGLCGRRETKRLNAWLFFAIAALLVLKTYDFGVVNWLGHLPLIERVNFRLFAPPVAGFALAILVGSGVQVVARRDLVVRRFLVALAAGALVLAWVLVSEGTWDLVRSPQGHSFLDTWARAFGFAALVATLLVVAIVTARAARGAAFARWIALALGVVVVVELFALAPFDIYAKRSDPYRRPAWAALVDEALAGAPDGRVIGLDGRLYPNTASGLGYADIRALDALYVERYWRYVKTFLQPTVYDRFIGEPWGSDEQEVVRYRENPMFDALGVRAFVADTPLVESPVASDSPGNVALRLVGRAAKTSVYENAGAYPRAWVVHTVHAVADEDRAFSYLRRHTLTGADGIIVDDFDPRAEAVVETSDSTAPGIRHLRPGRSRCDGDTDRARITDYDFNSVTIRVHAECAGLLVLPDTYFPGWTATVDGRSEAVRPTNGALRGVLVPKGASTVTFHYHPRRFDAGLVLALLGLAGFSTIALVRHRRRDRSGAAVT